jgi:hypothetical protein
MSDPIQIPSIQFDEQDNLILTASATSSKDDFDFYVGNWKLQNKKLKTRFNNCNEWIEFTTTTNMFKTLNGYGNIDTNFTSIDGVPFEGLSIRFFNPSTRLWSIHWADTNTLALDKPTVGSFDNEFGHFFTKDVIEGRDVIVVYRWDIRDPLKPIWSQAFSPDKGRSWEWNWYMYFEKADG